MAKNNGESRYIERTICMTHCPKCGKYIPDGGRMCIACGWKPEEDESFLKDNPYINYLQRVMDTVVNEFPGKDGEEFKAKLQDHDNSGWIAAAGYLGPAFIYTYLKYGEYDIVRYHANQACILFLLNIGAEFIGKTPILGKALKSVASMALFALAFIGARAAVAKKCEPVPLVGELGIELLK